MMGISPARVLANSVNGLFPFMPHHLVGYARVSTLDQKLHLQLDALQTAGCDRVFSDHASGAKAERPGLLKALDYVRRGDTLVVWRLDRFGRSLGDLVHKVEALEQQGIGFRSLQEAIDTTSPSGKLVFHLFGALSEFERDLVRERTMAGLASARARGRKGGRPRSMGEGKVKLASRLMRDPELSIAEVCRAVGVSSATLYRYVGPDGTIRER